VRIDTVRPFSLGGQPLDHPGQPIGSERF
jgi:hypothetical protein